MNHTAGKLRSISLLIVAEVLAMSLWFISAAILGDLTAETQLSAAFQAALSSSVQAGFVIGAVALAIAGIADRFEPKYVFALFSCIAALANALLTVIPVDSWLTILMRGVTGAALAGVYPVGMKIAVGWGQRDRGLLVGLLVGGLTLGSAAPHLMAFLGGAEWRSTVLIASVLALLASFLILITTTGPYHAKAARFDPSVIMQAWRNKKIRHAYGGYLGHMWELYAMWSWIAVALTVSFSVSMGATDAAEYAKLVTFVVIACGAISCGFAGWIADKIGKAELTIVAMLVSGLSALLFAFSFSGPVWITVLITLVWGISIIPDSAQFSALVADYAKSEQAGSLLTFQTALGFTLTILTVQLMPVVAGWLGWSTAMGLLAIGPALGILSMLHLRRSHQHA